MKDEKQEVPVPGADKVASGPLSIGGTMSEASEKQTFWDGKLPFEGHIVHWKRR
jgi:hypothetical protein